MSTTYLSTMLVIGATPELRAEAHQQLQSENGSGISFSLCGDSQVEVRHDPDKIVYEFAAYNVPPIDLARDLAAEFQTLRVVVNFAENGEYRAWRVTFEGVTGTAEERTEEYRADEGNMDFEADIPTPMCYFIEDSADWRKIFAPEPPPASDSETGLGPWREY